MIDNGTPTTTQSSDRSRNSSFGLPLFMVALFGAGALCTLIPGMVSENSKEKVIRAQRFVLVDELGRERAVLGFRENAAGLYVEGQGTEGRALISVEVDSEKVERPEGPMVFDSPRVVLKGNVLKQNATLFPHGLYVANEEDDATVSLSYFKVPMLQFVDKSGFPYVWLGHDDREGAKLKMGMPLGMKDAFKEVGEAVREGKPSDPRINEGLRRSLRLECGAPYNDVPYIRLYKDGNTFWETK